MGDKLTSAAGRVRRLTATLAGCVLVASACALTPGSSAPPPPLDDTPVWMLGDSLAWATAAHMQPLPAVGAVGAAGFTSAATSKILDHAIPLLAGHNDPTHVLVLGGVNDLKPWITTADVTTGMQELEDEMTSRGIATVWIAQPGWSYAAALDPIADWVNAKTLSIDCRQVAGPSTDGIHPSNYGPFSGCIDDALASMGITWTND